MPTGCRRSTAASRDASSASSDSRVGWMSASDILALEARGQGAAVEAGVLNLERLVALVVDDDRDPVDADRRALCERAAETVESDAIAEPVVRPGARRDRRV